VIFVTTGTHYLPFDRLLKIINKLMTDYSITDEVVIQSGSSKINVKNTNIQPFYSYQQMIRHISEARVVITAAGPATIFQVLTYGKNVPIVIPRTKKHNEHVSDHQLHFAKYLEKKSFCKMISSAEELHHLIQYDHKIPIRQSLLPSNNLEKRLLTYLAND